MLAVRDTDVGPAARSATSSFGLSCARAIGTRADPRLIRVAVAIVTVSVCPLSAPSCGPVQRTPTDSEPGVTAVTVPANQWPPAAVTAGAALVAASPARVVAP